MPMPFHVFHLSAWPGRLCAVLGLAVLAVLAACGLKDGGRQVVGGDAAIGQQLATQYQCGACHAIPGIRGAGGEAGPSLEGFGKLSYIAGRIPNQPDRLSAWLIDPPALKPGTAMPATGMTEQEARHIAAFLYTLR